MILKGLSSYPRSTNAAGLLGGLIWRIRADAARAFGHTACKACGRSTFSFSPVKSSH